MYYQILLNNVRIEGKNVILLDAFISILFGIYLKQLFKVGFHFRTTKTNHTNQT